MDEVKCNFCDETVSSIVDWSNGQLKTTTMLKNRFAPENDE